MAVARGLITTTLAGLCATAICVPWALAQEPKTKSPPGTPVKPPPLRLSPDSAVWIDRENKRLIVEGEVCLTRGQLEMFACPKGTKEHESVVAVDAKAYVVHAGLLALGAKQGRPVQFDPEYVPATGARIDVHCFWIAEDGSQKQATAQQWIRNVKTKKPLEYPWVFAGSDFWLDENTGKRHYLGETGDFICVSNFPSATLDLPVISSQDNENLLYEAFTENIPPRGTRVTLVLVPRLENDGKQDGKPAPKAAKAPAKTGNR
jgi:hypothetical protein